MAAALSAAQLSLFAGKFAGDYFQTCIMIENFTDGEHDDYYDGFWSYFTSFLEQREAFAFDSSLNKIFSDFSNTLLPYIDSLPCDPGEKARLKLVPSSAKECENILRELRTIEERC